MLYGARCEATIPDVGGVTCVLEHGHEDPHRPEWPDDATRCDYVFLDQGLPRPRCRRHMAHGGDHEADR